MRILVVIMKFNYGQIELGINAEFYNLYQTLKEMYTEVQLFDYMTQLQEVGQEQMNQDLKNKVLEFNPDIALFSMYTDQFIPLVLDEIKRRTVTVYYAYDDMWRQGYIDTWASHFTYVITSHIKGVKNMCMRGHQNGIFLSLGVNHKIYTKKEIQKKFDVAFVGGWHPHRAWLISWIEKSGVNVEVWGKKWKNGPINQEQMVELFNQSRINLNLQNETSWDVRYLMSSPWAIRNTLKSKKHFAPVNLRTFEINSCGGFQLLPYMEGLEKRYDIGNEVELFYSPEQLVERVHYFLKHEDEREAIAQRGLLRTLNDHTMEKRFTELFQKILPG